MGRWVGAAAFALDGQRLRPDKDGTIDETDYETVIDAELKRADTDGDVTLSKEELGPYRQEAARFFQKSALFARTIKAAVFPQPFS